MILYTSVFNFEVIYIRRSSVIPYILIIFHNSRFEGVFRFEILRGEEKFFSVSLTNAVRRRKWAKLGR